MTQLVALSGSIRRGSFNTALARALGELAPSGTTVDVATPADIPVYDGDLETEHGIPPAVDALKARIVGADGMILVTPEYNQGVPGALKNAMDWLSRPPADIGRVFRDRPFALCGASAGSGGSRAAQYAWLPTLRALGVHLWNGGTLFVPSASNAFDEQGRLVDDKLRERASGFVGGFADFCAGG
jgi:NAD(P)H-dependent FMN reductase